MTTIATDGKSMAGDGLVTSNDAICSSSFEKVRRLPDGRIVGVCGCVFYAAPFMAWLETGGDMPKLGSDFEALVLMPDGSCLCYDEHGRFVAEDLPTATGSGKRFAMGAMDAGATPEEAVHIACARDCSSGGTIAAFHLEPTA